MTVEIALDDLDVTSNRSPDFIDAHPLIRDAAILATRPLEAFVNELRLWLDNLLPGGAVWGHQRVGKTQAVRFLIENSERLLSSPIPTTPMSVWDPKFSNLSENRFFGEMLHSLGYALPKSGRAAEKRRRTIDFMVQRVYEAKEHRYLLFIDEAQWLAVAQLRYLMDLHNQLKIADVRLVTVLVGQPELMDMKMSLRSARQNHLLGRFMTATHQFHGVMTRADFQRMLRAIDERSEYPIGSGISYTQYFVPRAFSSGWRLLKQADVIWEMLDTILRREAVPNFKEYPMQALTALIRWLLQALMEKDTEALVLEPALVEEAIYRVALLQLEDHAYQESGIPEQVKQRG